MDTKICRYCHKEKDAGCFARNKRNPDGRANQCKSCRKLYNVEHFRDAQERMKRIKEKFYELSWEKLNEIVQYNPEAGVVSQNGNLVPTSVQSDGYLRVYINKCPISVHRLAFFIMTKRWPEKVDHIDGNPANNVWYNLRESNTRKNGCNRIEHRNGKMLGATYTKRTGKWQAQITCEDGKQRSLGYYATEYEAALEYARYAVKHSLLPRDMFKFTDKELHLC